jgi:hypothetical protein
MARRPFSFPLLLLLLLSVVPAVRSLKLHADAAPREQAETIVGVPWLARMADKAQLSSEHRLPGELQFPCPNDKKLCSSLGIQPENFRFMVVNSENDQALGYKILDAVGTHTLMALQHPRFKKHTDPSQMKGC